MNNNLAVKNSSVCEIVDVRGLSKSIYKPSNYTSRGKKKATPSDPIRTVDDIRLIDNYFLTTGKERFRARNHTIFVVGISLGIRAADLLRLKVRDIAYRNIDNEWEIVYEVSCFESKTKKMNHPILNEKARYVLWEYLNRNDFYDFSEDDYLFQSYRGKEPLNSHSLYRILQDMQKELNLPYQLGAHSLRKTFAYWTIRMHLDDQNVLFSLQEMLNHDSMKTTLHYSGHTKEDLRVMYNDIERLFNGDVDCEPTKEKQEDKLDKILALLEA